MIEVKDWIAAAALVFAIFNALVLYISQASRAAKSEVRGHGDRITKIEAQIDGLPSTDSFHKLELELSEMRGSLRVQETQQTTLINGMARIERFMEALEFNPPVRARQKKT